MLRVDGVCRMIELLCVDCCWLCVVRCCSLFVVCSVLRVRRLSCVVCCWLLCVVVGCWCMLVFGCVILVRCSCSLLVDGPS